jgi:murein DD-endopeptidase MepM/ murein hydrolase activator NlpD
LPKLLVIVLSFFSLSGFTSVGKMESELNKKRTIIQNLAAKIKKIESTIGQKNDDYLARIENLNQYQKRMSLLYKSLSSLDKKLTKDINNSKKILLSMINEMNDNFDDSSELRVYLQRKILAKKIAKNIERKKEIKLMQETLSQYKKNVTEVKKEEKELYNLIISLEDQKRQLSSKYMRELEQKNELESKIESVSALKKAKKKLKRTSSISLPWNLTLPISKFVAYKPSKKGVTFNFKERTSVVATAPGKISYAGKLSSYGNLVMIDHGNDLRSVILGDFVIGALKGKRVQAGDVIGMTNLTQGEGKNIYFELRKKNIVQNTISLLKNYNEKFKNI